jgi:hypothetical protein
MVISMEMESGARIYEDPESDAGQAYGDEVLNANLLPPEVVLGLQEVPVASPERHFVPTDVDAFLSAVYRFQE